MKRLLVLLVTVVMSLGLFGCGGDGSGVAVSDSSNNPPESTTISGVAAAGAPLSGYVSLVDSLGEPSPALSTLLASDGSFTFDVTDLTPPFFLKAEGVAGNTGYELHSVVTGTGTANVNPLTEAQVAAATGKDPAELYADPSSTGLSNEDMQAALDQAADDLQTMLQPMLDAWQKPNLNPITDVYVADGTGLDAFLDVAEVNVSNGGIQVVDRTTQTTIAEATIDANGGGMGNMDTMSAEEATQTTTVVSDLDQIRAFLREWLTAMKNISYTFVTDGYPNGQQEALDAMMPYYTDAQSFGINNGKTLDQELETHLEDYVFLSAIKAVSGVGIASHDSTTGVYMVDCTLMLQLDGAAAPYPLKGFAVVKEGDTWKVTGNGFYADPSNMDLFYFKTKRLIYPEQSRQLTAIDFEMDDIQQVFSSATVTGPGLPDGGIEFLPNVNDGDMVMDESLMACARVNSDGSCMERDWNAYELTDDVIANMPQTCTYTFTFYFADGGSEVHTVTGPAKPLQSSAITDGHFPVVDTSIEPTLSWASNYLVGKTMNFNYSAPTAFEALHIGFGSWLDYSDANSGWNHIESWNDEAQIGTNLTAPLTTAALPDGATLESGDLEFSVQDPLWLNYTVEYDFR